MEQTQQVILSVKRSINTIDGQVIDYLQTEPFGLGNVPEIVMLTLKQYWSPFAISANGVNGEQLRQRAIWSIKQLEAQAALIREVFLEPHETAAVNISNPLVTASYATSEVIASETQREDEEDDGLLSIEPSEEMKQINKFFGVA